MQLAGVTRRRRRQKCRRNGAAGLAKPRSVGPANPSPPCQTQQQPSEWEGGKRVSRICAKGASLRFAAVPTSSSAAHSPPTRVLQKAAQRTASTSPPLFCSFTRTLFALLRDGQPARTFRRKKSWALAREFERAPSTTCRKTLPRKERTQKTRARSSPGEATPYSSSPSEPNREEGARPDEGTAASIREPPPQAVLHKSRYGSQFRRCARRLDDRRSRGRISPSAFFLLQHLTPAFCSRMQRRKTGKVTRERSEAKMGQRS